ncbi:MJ1255/VC2487 family glycosyltransferase [Oceanicoccus sp. KOV_DT_Chl]|uniref:MJ1255/VC2487 family glycosyltransferase n=1 Tax=Oceanicoccus sp. KOV_DT_Chl TaxID=1904639 RepID=UPI00190E7F48|nr:MJ1255/VC2487 family glycosyltransferase [Oceanicoccus sp. KOV_DT_Chl]
MKILYGVQGTGNGHITRARVMAKQFALAAQIQPIEVTYLFSGRDADKLFDMDCFGKYLHRQGLTFVSEAGEINYQKTLSNNKPLQFIRDIKSLPLSDYDLIISDFEPVTAWAAKLQGKPVLGISHQNSFAYDIPTASTNFIANSIMRNFAPGRWKIGLHWHHFGHPILPPIIDTELKPKACNSSVLVYLPFENQDDVTELLHRFPRQHFVQYSPDLDNGTLHNVQLRKTCHDGFKADLSKSRAVICNAGFELISECLQLNLPILAKPLQGQMEQLSNAAALEKLGYATTLNVLDRETIAEWLVLAKKPHY